MSRVDRLILLFLDVDGVLNRHDKSWLDPELVANLNWLVARCSEIKIVFNTAWNRHPVAKLKTMMEDAGFKHPARIRGKTDSCSGGGEPCRRYLEAHDLVGTPYIIIDDSDHDYGEMWCRLVKCQSNRGFDEKRRGAANDLAWKSRNPDEDRDRRIAVGGLVDRAFQVMQADWLTPEQKESYVARDLDLAAQCITMPDFHRRAMVTPPEPPESA